MNHSFDSFDVLSFGFFKYSSEYRHMKYTRIFRTVPGPWRPFSFGPWSQSKFSQWSLVPGTIWPNVPGPGNPIQSPNSVDNLDQIFCGWCIFDHFGEIVSVV